MDEQGETRAARFDRARLLRIGAIAAAPFALGIERAAAAAGDTLFSDRAPSFAAREKRGEFAAWPTFGGGYHYVPHRVVTIEADAAAVRRRLAAAGVKSVPVDSALNVVGAVELRLASNVAVPQILTKVFGSNPSNGRQLTVAPHYLLVGEPEYEGGPYGPPEPAKPGEPFAPGTQDGPRVAVIDTGYHPGIHRDLDTHVPPVTAPQLPDAMPAHGMLDDEAAHGLFITGIIVHAAPKAIVENVRVLDGMGLGTEAAVVGAVASYRGRPEVSVINMSLGTFGDPRFPPVGLALALAQLPRTTAVIAAAGNHHTNQPMYPAAYKRAVAVAAAADSGGAPASYSNYGPWVDCYAPGTVENGAFDDWKGSVPTVPQPTNEVFTGWAKWSGTSFAAPKLTGAIAASVSATVSGQQAADALVHDPTRPILVDYGRFLDL